jgi:preprotein translocase subunit YajC
MKALSRARDSNYNLIGAYRLSMDALLLTILGAVALVGGSVFISSEIQRKQGKTDAQISSRENNMSFWLPVVIGFVIFTILIMVKGES